MQISTQLQWRNAKVKSDGSGSKGRTPCTCLCYRCCALEQGTYRRARRTKRGQAICPSVRSASTKDFTSGNETRTQNSCASVPIRIVSYSYTVYSTVRCSYKCSLQNTFQVLYTNIVICNTGPYYTNRHQGWSKLHTAFMKLTSKIPYFS